MFLSTWFDFVKAHEKIVVAGVLALALFGGIERIDTLIAKHDKAAQSAQQIVVDADIKKNADYALIVAQDKADRDALEARLEAQNAALNQTTIALAAALANQQKADAAMTPTELTRHWDELVPAAGAAVTPNGVTLPEVGAVATVQALDSGQEKAKELTACQQEVTNDETMLTQDKKSLTDLGAQVAELNGQIIDERKLHVDEIKTVKAEARRGKLRAFAEGIGVGIGVVIRFIK